MLTKDLLRFATDGDSVSPRFIKATPAVRRLADSLLQAWRAAIGQSQAEVDEVSNRCCYTARSLVMARGLQKLLADGSRFDEAPGLADQRWEVLQTSAALLTEHAPAASAVAHRQAVEERLAVLEQALPDDLYADLPQSAVLKEVPDWTVEELVARYNLAQVQGLLLTASSMTVHIPDAGTGRRRQLLKALRFQRLLADVRENDGDLVLQVSGPGSVLDQAQRYGLQLAFFLPVVTLADQWQIIAEVRPERRGPGRQLVLDQSSGLRGMSQFHDYVPAELQGLCDKIIKKRKDWQVTSDTSLLTIPGSGELVVPDLQITPPGQDPVWVEFFHRWHSHPVQRRLQQMREGALPHLVLGVDRVLAKRKEVASLLTGELFDQRGFLFSAYPAPTAVIKAVEQISRTDA